MEDQYASDKYILSSMNQSESQAAQNPLTPMNKATKVQATLVKQANMLQGK